MRLICPHCQQSVTVPDSAAGTPTPCPLCNQSITPPALTGAAIDAAPVPPPAPPPPKRESERPVVSNTPIAYAPGSPNATKPWMHLTLRRHVAPWITPAALVLAFFLTLFTWVAIAPNGNRIYTQNAWQAASGGFTTDLVGDRIMAAETELKSNMGMSVWILFYLILIFPACALAIADRVLAHKPMVVPDVFRSVWPHRQLVVAGLCAVLLLCLLWPMTFHFGLESAAIAAAEAAVPAAQATAGKPEPTTTEKTERDLHRDIKLASYGLKRAVWFDLAILVQLIALVGIGTAWWLDRHPNAPDPRLEVYC